MTTQPDGTAVRVPGTHCVSPYANAERGMSAPVKTAMAMMERARVPRRDLDLMLDMTRRPKTFHQRSPFPAQQFPGTRAIAQLRHGDSPESGRGAQGASVRRVQVSGAGCQLGEMRSGPQSSRTTWSR